MKRHPRLQPLSREHHRTLLVWRKLDQAIQRPSRSNISTILKELQHYWSSRFESHMQQEEKSLLPRLSSLLQERMRREHETLRSMYEHLVAVEPVDLLAADTFAKTLRAHIRWEERTVFSYLQEQLTDAELGSLFDAVKADEE